MTQHIDDRLRVVESNVAALNERANNSTVSHADLKNEIDQLWGKVNDTHDAVANLTTNVATQFTTLTNHIDIYKRTPAQEWTGRSIWTGLGAAAGSAAWLIYQLLATGGLP